MVRVGSLALVFLALAGGSFAQSGLNTIATTEILPYREGSAEVEHGNIGFRRPEFFRAPHPVILGEFGLMRGVEGGFEWRRVEEVERRELSFNLKAKVNNEGPLIPRLAVGFADLGNRQRPTYFIAASKTLDYQYERTRRHRHHKILGRVFHAGLFLPNREVALPYFGLEYSMHENLVLMADWISGDEGAITVGFEWVLPDADTAVHPALFFSNEQHRLDGFLLNISRQFRF